MIDLSQFECKSAPLMVRIWPDKTWAIAEDIKEGEYSHMSDDYIGIDFNDFDACSKLDQALYVELMEAIIGPDPASDQ